MSSLKTGKSSKGRTHAPVTSSIPYGAHAQPHRRAVGARRAAGEPLGSFPGVLAGHPDLLDPQVPGDLVVAALAGQRRGGLGAGVAELLGVDVAPAARARQARLAAEANPRSATHTRRRRFHAPGSSLTLRMIFWPFSLPGKVQQRTGMPSRVTAIAITTCGRSSRWSLECPNRRAPSSPGGFPRPRPRPAVVAGDLGQPGRRVHLPVGRRGVDEYDADAEVQQMRCGRRSPTRSPPAGSPSPGTSGRR